MKKSVSILGFLSLCMLWATPAFAYSTSNVTAEVKSGGSWHVTTSDIERDGDCGTNCKIYDIGMSAS